ncbi:hypothetical protein NQZ68_031634 [Dissostichus eleginoides]|nr:hypothetical protein NQZ68_031634 [Dissostichus eleginoides]
MGHSTELDQSQFFLLWDFFSWDCERKSCGSPQRSEGNSDAHEATLRHFDYWQLSRLAGQEANCCSTFKDV